MRIRIIQPCSTIYIYDRCFWTKRNSCCCFVCFTTFASNLFIYFFFSFIFFLLSSIYLFKSILLLDIFDAQEERWKETEKTRNIQDSSHYICCWCDFHYNSHDENQKQENKWRKSEKTKKERKKKIKNIYYDKTNWENRNKDAFLKKRKFKWVKYGLDSTFFCILYLYKFK